MIQRVEFGGTIFTSGQKYSLQYFEPNEVNADYETASYLGQDGQSILSAYYEPRYIFLNGHIMAKNKAEYYALRQQLISLCDAKTERELVYFNGIKYYSVKAIGSVPIFEAPKGYCLPFSIKFVAPSFFWKDKTPIESKVIQYVPLIKTFNFNPYFMFSQTTTNATIFNSSGIETPFEIEIVGTGGISSATYGVKITNETTGDVIEIEKDVEDGEIITINTEKATAISSIVGNIITKITDESVPEMLLVSGNNLIKAENFNVNNNISVTIIYKKRYVGV